MQDLFASWDTIKGQCSKPFHLWELLSLNVVFVYFCTIPFIVMLIMRRQYAALGRVIGFYVGIPLTFFLAAIGLIWSETPEATTCIPSDHDWKMKIVMDMCFVTCGILIVLYFLRKVLRKMERSVLSIQEQIDECIASHGMPAAVPHIQAIFIATPWINPIKVGFATSELMLLPSNIPSMGEHFQEDLRECPICLLALNEGRAYVMLPQCEHRFHPPCVKDWLKQKPICPCCRRNVRDALYESLTSSRYIGPGNLEQP